MDKPKCGNPECVDGTRAVPIGGGLVRYEFCHDPIHNGPLITCDCANAHGLPDPQPEYICPNHRPQEPMADGLYSVTNFGDGIVFKGPGLNPTRYALVGTTDWWKLIEARLNIAYLEGQMAMEEKLRIAVEALKAIRVSIGYQASQEFAKEALAKIHGGKG